MRSRSRRNRERVRGGGGGVTFSGKEMSTLRIKKETLRKDLPILPDDTSGFDDGLRRHARGQTFRRCRGARHVREMSRTEPIPSSRDGGGGFSFLTPNRRFISFSPLFFLWGGGCRVMGPRLYLFIFYFSSPAPPHHTHAGRVGRTRAVRGLHSRAPARGGSNKLRTFTRAFESCARA